MTKRFLALALTGALTLTMLTACAPSGGEASPSANPSASPSETVIPTPTPTPTPSETPVPTETVEPSETAAPSESAKPSETAKPSEKPAESAKPSEKPAESAKPSEKPAESAKPSESPKPEKSVVQSIWDEVSSQERPSLMDLNAELLSTLYGINSSDLVEYIAKMPMMSANVTEFLIAKVAPGKMDAVKAACEKRQADLAANTLYPETVKLVEAYKLVTSGDYILFAIDEYAADMVTAFNNYAK